MSAGLGVIGLHWVMMKNIHFILLRILYTKLGASFYYCVQTAAPACTELEVKVMNSLGKLLNLPPSFLNCSPGPGGGVLQVSRRSQYKFLPGENPPSRESI